MTADRVTKALELTSAAVISLALLQGALYELRMDGVGCLADRELELLCHRVKGELRRYAVLRHREEES